MKTLKYISTKTKQIIVSILTYLFLVIDRLILTPFPFMESKSIEQYGKEGEDSTLIFSFMRVTLTISIVVMTLLIRWIF